MGISLAIVSNVEMLNEQGLGCENLLNTINFDINASSWAGGHALVVSPKDCALDSFPCARL